MFSERKSNLESGEDMAAYDSLMVFTGNANPELAQRVVNIWIFHSVKPPFPNSQMAK